MSTTSMVVAGSPCEKSLTGAKTTSAPPLAGDVQPASTVAISSPAAIAASRFRDTYVLLIAVGCARDRLGQRAASQHLGASQLADAGGQRQGIQEARSVCWSASPARARKSPVRRAT